MTSTRYVSAVALILLLAGCVNPAGQSGGSVIGEDIRAVEDEGAPVAVPTLLPAGYEFIGRVGVSRRRDLAVASAWLYAPEDGSAGPPVHVCVIARGDDSVCPSGLLRERVERSTQHYTVIVSSADKDHPGLGGAWVDAEFTEDWRGVNWIENA